MNRHTSSGDTHPSHDDRAFAERIAQHYAMSAPTPAERAAFDRRLAERLEARPGFDYSWWPALAFAGAAAVLAFVLLGGAPLEAPVDQGAGGDRVAMTDDASDGSGAFVDEPAGVLDQPELVLLSAAYEGSAESGEDVAASDEQVDSSLPSDYQAIASLLL